MQLPLMVQFAAEYGDFNIVDGIFKVTAYDLVLIMFTNVDFLGKSSLTMAFRLSQNSAATMKAAHLFSLGKEGLQYL